MSDNLAICVVLSLFSFFPLFCLLQQAERLLVHLRTEIYSHLLNLVSVGVICGGGGEVSNSGFRVSTVFFRLIPHSIS